MKIIVLATMLLLSTSVSAQKCTVSGTGSCGTEGAKCLTDAGKKGSCKTHVMQDGKKCYCAKNLPSN